MKKLLGTAALAALSLSLAHPANASLVIGLVPTSGNINAVNSGDVLNFNVVATVVGANSTADEGLQSAVGSFVSTPSGNGPVGNFSTVTLASPFNSGSTPGVIQDLNGLPGLDVGSNDKSSSLSYVFAHAASIVTDANEVGDTAHFLLGTVSFTVTSVAGSGTTALTWIPRTNSSGGNLNTAALWNEDGDPTVASNHRNPTSAGNSYSGGTVTLTSNATPEPGSLALASLGGLGLLLRRRRNA